jgi:hypothetical protein
VQSAFEYVQTALVEYNKIESDFCSEKWGQILESYALWANVSRRIRTYCESMANLGVDQTVLGSGTAKREKKTPLDDDHIPSELLPVTPFLEPEFSTEDTSEDILEGLSEGTSEYRICDCCGLDTLQDLFSCCACGAPLCNSGTTICSNKIE